MSFTWFFPSLMALRKAQPGWAIKTHFKKSRLFWYLLNRRLLNSFKSWDFFCIDRIKNLSAMSNKAYNLCIKIVQHYFMYTANWSWQGWAIYNFFVFLQIHESKIFSQQYFLLSTWKKLLFLQYFAFRVSLNQIRIFSFPETQDRSESFKLVNQTSRTLWSRVVNFWEWQPLLLTGWHFDCLFQTKFIRKLAKCCQKS